MRTDEPGMKIRGTSSDEPELFKHRDIQSMRSAIIAAPGEIDFRSAVLPEPKAGQVRVRLEGCGVCASNLPVWEGRPWFEYPAEPGAPGHEGWGRIDALGEGVTGLSPGERVSFLSGHAFAEYDVTDAGAVVPVPDALRDRPFPGEPLGCAMNVFRRSDIREGQWVAVVGIGFLGALLVELAVRANARVIAISRSQFALDMARRLGAEKTIPHGEKWQVIDEVRNITGDVFCDRVIEATGHQEPLDIAGEIVRVRGRLIIAGFHQDGLRQVNMQQWNWRGIDVINAHERDPEMYVRGMREAVNAVIDGRLNPFPLLTHVYRFQDLLRAFEALRRRPEGFIKAIVNF